MSSFLDETVNKYLHQKKKSPIQPLLFSHHNEPQISDKTKKQINYLLKLSTPKTLDSNNLKIKEYLSSLSMRERYEDLLSRKELILPPKYKLLFKKQGFLDFFLSNVEKEHKFNLLIKEYLNLNHSQISIEDFEKILRVTPFYYIYQSKLSRNGKIELISIDLPFDYEERMKKKYAPTTNFSVMQTVCEPFKGKVNQNVIEKRKKFFKKVLIYITKEQHDSFLKENNIPYFDAALNKTWHHLFDLNEVKDIENFKIVEYNPTERKKRQMR